MDPCQQRRESKLRHREEEASEFFDAVLAAVLAVSGEQAGSVGESLIGTEAGGVSGSEEAPPRAR